MGFWTVATKILELNELWWAAITVWPQPVPSVKTSFVTIALAMDSQHLKMIQYSWVRQCYYSKGGKKKSNWLKLRKGVSPEAHILYLDAVPDGARATAGHRHSKTHSTGFLEDLRDFPHCPALMQRSSWVMHVFHVPSPLPSLSMVHSGGWSTAYNLLVSSSIAMSWAGESLIALIGTVFLE